MKKLILSLCFLLSSLGAADSWYNKFHLGLEAGVFMNNFGGDIENATPSLTRFSDDLNYKNTDSSFFALHLKNDIDYVPDLDISYMNVQQNRNAELNDQKFVAAGDYNGSVRSKISYNVLNTVVKSSFKYKGSMKKFFSWNFYTGDVEYNIGINAKFISYRFDIEKSDTTDANFISVESAIILPYLGAKYYWYDFILHGHVSALSFSDAKATSYEAGIDYQLFKNFYLSASYMYEDFEATEKLDTVYFKSYGNKLAMKYYF